MIREECKKYDRCSAPICPLSEQTLKHGIWYPDEEVCTLHQHQWIKIQRKVVKKARDKDHYFTLQMLQRDCVIGKGIDGLDPDKEDRRGQLKRWLKAHPPKRVLTDEERAKVAERFKHARG